jgi:hypothetical protein
VSQELPEPPKDTRWLERIALIVGIVSGLTGVIQFVATLIGWWLH